MNESTKEIIVQKLARMKQPVALQSDAMVSWSNARGTDIWAMLTAAIKGDLDSIKALVAKDADLVNCSFEYLTPIRFAVRENHRHVVEYLLEKGAHAVLDFSDSLLTIAHDRGYEELASLLALHLKERYKIAPEGEMLSELIRAFEVQSVKDALKDNPGLLYIADKRGNLPIHWAVLTRQLGLIEYFLQQGADVNAMRADGARPLDLTNGDYYYRSWYRDLPPTGLQKHELLAGYLIAKGAYYDISVAAKLGHYDRVKELLDEDVSLANKLPSYVSGYSGLPLRCAAIGGYLEIVKLLLERGANPNEPEPGIAQQGAALHAAVGRKHISIIKLLLEHGADPNSHVESAANSLWMAKHVEAPKEIIDLIITHGGRLTVEFICYDGDLELLSHMLLANPNLPFDEDENRIILENKGVMELILARQPDILKRFSIRSLSDPVLARWLIDHGLDPNKGDWLGVTPLHRAASDGNIEMADIYLQAGADINATDTDLSSTALGWAARNGQKEMVAYLLEKGADPLLPVDEPWARPSAWAQRRGHDEIASIIK